MSLAAIQLNRDPAFSEAVAGLRADNAEGLAAVDQEIISRLASSVDMIPEIAGHLVQAGGKRLRPLLTLAAAGLFSYRGEKHVPLAAAVELIHGATLLHDDVVDESRMRRGEKTANLIWGNKESVLVGDYIFSRAFELMVATGSLQVLQILSHASSVIAEGEIMQLTTQNNLQTDIDRYLSVINAKTAALFSAATHTGAIIAGASPRESEAMAQFGQNFGTAYQLIDDALDYAGFEADLGKSVGDDFREGKMTLPVIISFATADDDEKAFWTRTINRGEIGEGDFQRAVAIMEREQAVRRTLDVARDYTRAALGNLDDVPECPGTDRLRQLATTSLSRAH